MTKGAHSAYGGCCSRTKYFFKITTVIGFHEFRNTELADRNVQMHLMSEINNAFSGDPIQNTVISRGCYQCVAYAKNTFMVPASSKNSWELASVQIIW